MFESLTGFSYQIVYLFSQMTLGDVLDIALVAAVFFVAFQALHQTRALQLLRGVIIFAILGVFLLVVLPLTTFGYLIRGLLLAGLIALPWLFQDELRRALTGLGRIGRPRSYSSSFDRFKDILTTTASQLSSQRDGALLVLEGLTPLEEIIQTGIPIQAEAISPELLLSIFRDKSPLHDGAVVLRGDRLVAAGVILPIMTEETGRTHLGTRHRSALGLATQVHDALVIVVSEETGRISAAINGHIYRGLSTEKLESWLDRFQDQFIGNGRTRWDWLRGGGVRTVFTNSLLAVGLAIVAWVGVTFQTNPPQQVVIRDVPVSIAMPPSDLILMTDIPSTVNTTIQTTRDRLGGLSAATIQASVDLNNIPAGIHRVPVEITLADERARSLSVVPDSVNIVLEPVESIEVKPTVTILDPEALPFGYAIGEIDVSPDTVTVKGPQSSVFDVVELRAELSIDGNRTGFQENLLVIPFNKDDQIADGVRIFPSEVRVNVPISRTILTRQVPIQPDFRAETLPAGYEITSVRLSVPSVSLAGSTSSLDSVGDFILTAPITLTNVYSEFSIDAPLILSEGVTAREETGAAINSVTVDISVAPATNYLLQTSAPAVRGVPENFTAEVSPGQVSILLVGPQPILDEIGLNPSLIIVFVDVNELPAGTHILPLQYEAPSGIKVELFPSEVQVNLLEKTNS